MNVSPVPSAVLAIALLFAASTNAEQIYGLGFPSNEGTFNVIEGKPYLLRQENAVVRAMPWISRRTES